MVVGLSVILDPVWWQSLGNIIFSQYGLIGLFIFSIIGNATIFLPVPVDILVFIIAPLAGNPLMVLLIGIVSGAGAAIGELSGYAIGAMGIRGFETASKKKVVSVEEVQRRLKEKGWWVVFFGALLPFPFDIIGIAAGLIKYSLVSFFTAALAGKLIRYCLTAFASYYGIELIKIIFLGGG